MIFLFIWNSYREQGESRVDEEADLSPCPLLPLQFVPQMTAGA